VGAETVLLAVGADREISAVPLDVGRALRQDRENELLERLLGQAAAEGRLRPLAPFANLVIPPEILLPQPIVNRRAMGIVGNEQLRRVVCSGFSEEPSVIGIEGVVPSGDGSTDM
jgi:hypothetical protein